jgi:hypothetical protein
MTIRARVMGVLDASNTPISSINVLVLERQCESELPGERTCPCGDAPFDGTLERSVLELAGGKMRTKPSHPLLI